MNPLLKLQLDVAFAERAARYVTYAYAQERLARAFAAELSGYGDGPSDGEFEQLAAALTYSHNADVAYLALLGQATRELIEHVKSPPAQRTTNRRGWFLNPQR
ncbi:hypothetical protein WKW79_02550 [Variovorax robiniae]|uniref:Uncharacterized protein n=1 Tax=Variovorax robiniae TaxID=1836199 RepID=A0ABU8X2W9_9BURK